MGRSRGCLGWGSNGAESGTEGAAEPLVGKHRVRGALPHPGQLSCLGGGGLGMLQGSRWVPPPLLGDPAPGLNRAWLPQSSISCPCGQGPLSPELGWVQLWTQSSVAILMSPSLSAPAATQPPRAGARVRHAKTGHTSPLPILCHPAAWRNHRIAVLCREATAPAARRAPGQGMARVWGRSPTAAAAGGHLFCQSISPAFLPPPPRSTRPAPLPRASHSSWRLPWDRSGAVGEEGQRFLGDFVLLGVLKVWFTLGSSFAVARPVPPALLGAAVSCGAEKPARTELCSRASAFPVYTSMGEIRRSGFQRHSGGAATPTHFY